MPMIVVKHHESASEICRLTYRPVSNCPILRDFYTQTQSRESAPIPACPLQYCHPVSLQCFLLQVRPRRLKLSLLRQSRPSPASSGDQVRGISYLRLFSSSPVLFLILLLLCNHLIQRQYLEPTDDETPLQFRYTRPSLRTRHPDTFHKWLHECPRPLVYSFALGSVGVSGNATWPTASQKEVVCF